jgi:hypothetical protein
LGAYAFLACYGARVRFVRVLTPGVYSIQTMHPRVPGAWVDRDGIRLRGACDTHPGDVFDLAPMYDSALDARDVLVDGDGDGDGDDAGPQDGLCPWVWAVAERATAPHAPDGKRIRRMVPRFRLVCVSGDAATPPPEAIRATFVGTALFDARLAQDGFVYSSRIVFPGLAEAGVSW